MKRLILLLAIVGLMFTGNSMAMEGMDHKANNGKAMEGMDHGASTDDGNFTHTAMAGDMHTEFKVMDLASMNMKDPTGKTHHVMATFMRNGEKVSKVVGKMKLISPSKKEQTADLKDYGGGIFAANFTIDEPGKWGVICLFKDEQGQQTVKFWYPHMAM
jgi:hypothetical protein